MTIGFDTSPLIYQLVMLMATVGLGSWLFWNRSSNFPETAFLGLTSLYLFLQRLPVLVFNRELNADESQMLTQALTLTRDPVYWRSVDGTTGGPLSSYFLIPVGWLTGRFDYITAHCSALLLVIITLFFLYRALKNWFGASRAAIALFPVILFYGFTKNADFVHFTSEHTPIMLLAAALWIVSYPKFTDPQNRKLPFLLGVLLTLVPFGKLQAVPLGAVVAGYAFFLMLDSRSWNSLKWIVLGALFTLLAIGGLLTAGGVLKDFWVFYIQGNFQYKNDTPLADNLLVLWNSIVHARDLLILAIPTLIFGSYSLFQYDRNKKSAPVFLLGIMLTLATLYASSRTGSGYTHYLLFLILPVSLLIGSFIPNGLPLNNGRKWFYGGIPVLCAVPTLLMPYFRNGQFNPYPSGQGLNRSLPFTETGLEASKYLGKGDFLVVWGWNCQYYVECQAPQGVAENHSIRSAFEHPMRETYRDRYIQDLKRTRPAVFIDAVGNSLWLQDTVTQSYRTFPELAKFIDQHYILAGKPEGNRMFVRADLYRH